MKQNAINSSFTYRLRILLELEKTIPQRFGLRHRAAIGVTEKTDAVALVVSEETGQISYIKNGEFVMFDDISSLSELLEKDLA